MMITLVALVLLSIVILRVTTGFLMTDTIMLNSKVKLQAISICASIIEDGVGLAFDEKSVDPDTTTSNYIISTSNLTPVNQLGAEAGEVYPNFNDIDDYNGLTFLSTDTVTVRSPFAKMYSDEYTISCKVDYVQETNPDSAVSIPTWHKRLLVMVTSKVMNKTAEDLTNRTGDTLRMSVVQSNYAY